MARPKRNNADYFSHDAGMRDDPKIKALRNKFGITGYAVWCMMLELLTNADFFKIHIGSLEIEIFSADFGIDADSFSEILAYMLKLSLLQTEDNCEYLSQKLTDRLQPVIDKRRNSRPKGVSVAESTQSKVKETKVKKTKVETSIVIPSYIERAKWDDFIAHRKELKKPVTQTSMKGQLNKLENFEQTMKGGANISLTQTVVNGWLGLFEPKEEDFSFASAPWKELNNGEKVKLDMKKLIVYAENGAKHEFMQVDKNGGVFA